MSSTRLTDCTGPLNRTGKLDVCGSNNTSCKQIYTLIWIWTDEYENKDSFNIISIDLLGFRLYINYLLSK